MNIAMTVPAAPQRFKVRRFVMFAIILIAIEAGYTWTMARFGYKSTEKHLPGTVFVHCTKLGVQPTLGLVHSAPFAIDTHQIHQAEA